MKIVRSLLCSLAIMSSAQAEIISVKSMNEVQQKIENIDEKDVFIAFDVDMTITQPNHPAAFYPSLMQYTDIYKSTLKGLTPEQKDMVSTLTIFQPQILVEEGTPEIIKNLQRNHNVIAFTAVLATPEAMEHRIKTLQAMGVEFSSDLPEVTLKDVKVYNNHHPFFKAGILFGNGEAQGKGVVLWAFVKTLKTLPKMVIVIDDRKKHLEDIEKTLLEHEKDVKFLGLEYKGAFARRGEITKKEFKSFWRDLANQAKGKKS